jgi:hypothetical protein
MPPLGGLIQLVMYGMQDLSDTKYLIEQQKYKLTNKRVYINFACEVKEEDIPIIIHLYRKVEQKYYNYINNIKTYT